MPCSGMSRAQCGDGRTLSPWVVDDGRTAHRGRDTNVGVAPKAARVTTRMVAWGAGGSCVSELVGHPLN